MADQESQPQPRKRTAHKHHVSNENQSPMMENITQQINEIESIISNANTFKENYSILNKTMIPNINNTLKSYSRDAKMAVLNDAIELVLEGIDWDEMQNKLTSMLKAKTPNVNPHQWQRIPKPSAHLELMDDDPFTNMLINCSVENVKDFQKYRKSARAALSSTLNDVATFENEMCQYRSSVVDLLRSNIQTLFDYHYNYVNDIYHKRQTSSSVIIDGKNISLKKSQRDFITNGLRDLLIKK